MFISLRILYFILGIVDYAVLCLNLVVSAESCSQAQYLLVVQLVSLCVFLCFIQIGLAWHLLWVRVTLFLKVGFAEISFEFGTVQQILHSSSLQLRSHSFLRELQRTGPFKLCLLSHRSVSVHAEFVIWPKAPGHCCIFSRNRDISSPNSIPFCTLSPDSCCLSIPDFCLGLLFPKFWVES